ncbi:MULTISPECIES: NADPH-dependent F420 reductase [unclassified Streptomyces]|uniref:NADPH-dependent F420 reductase n=1 Tax=unclassified Streptomyces TaxID=2593676 RepID=UPI00168B89F2|nr:MULTISPECIES: NAD(P)-binding domain-containing protein [unclassified Streptomyces]MBD3003820.1 NAD(P)-binding domain-containing protein [Streptomyces sp. 5-10]
MKISLLGTGAVCHVLAPAFLALDHEVTVGTRNPRSTLSANHAYRRLADRHPSLELRTFEDAVPGAELVVNAIDGPSCVAALTPLAPLLTGRVVMDVSSPYDWSDPDAVLDPVNTDSLGERLQRALPDAKVVKTLNTLAAEAMTAPASIGDGDHTVFVSGDDTAAKALVSDLLRALGWRDVLDLGGIRTARATEMMLRMWIDTSAAVRTHMFGFKIVR